MSTQRPSFWHSFFHPAAWPPRPLRKLPEIRYVDAKEPFARRWLRTWSRGYWIEFVYLSTMQLFYLAAWIGLLVASGRYGIPIVRPMFKGTPWPFGFGAFVVWILLSAVAAAALMHVFARFLFRRFPVVRMLRWFRLRCELRRRGIPICVSCGYEGGDIDAPRCPECGAEQPMP